MLTRRGFLGSTLAATAWGLVARADQPPTRTCRLILVMAQGGWDTTYALDPKEPPLVDVPVGATRQFGGLDVFCDPSRPNVTAYFERHAERTVIVRGIATSTIVHNECHKRMTTGTRVETSPDVGAMVAHDLGNDLPLPYLILGEVAFTGPYAASAGRVGVTNQLATLVGAAPRPTCAMPPCRADVRDPLRVDEVAAIEDAALRRYAAASADRARATRGATGYNRRRVDDFASSIERASRLRALRAHFGVAGETLTFDGQIELALAALEQDISQAVMLSSGLLWDTHIFNRNQAAHHELLFAQVARLVDELAQRPGRTAGSRMIDDTIVVVFSEMTRTPKLTRYTEDGGKHHWPVAAAMVLGGGVRGGRVIGGTGPDQAALPVDLATGQLSPAGDKLVPAHFIGGVLALCGADPRDHFPATPVVLQLAQDALRT